MGRYLASLFNALSDTMMEESQAAANNSDPETAPVDLVSPTLATCPPFSYHHYGSFAYIGDLRAIADLRTEGRDRRFTFAGLATFLLWRSVYMSKLLSVRNRTLVGVDWLETMIFGRDISRG
jgi:NADH dehydrogenase FAD-containing subunit